MATITCPGGHSFSDGQIPSPYAWTLISDANLESALDRIIDRAKAGKDVEAQTGVIMNAYGYPAYICPECERLLVFDKGIENPATSYRRE